MVPAHRPAGQPAAQQPTAVFAVPQQAVYASQPHGGCDCSVPPNAPSSVKATRVTTIVIIILHSLALVAFGFYMIWQWIASLLAIISGSVLLCQYHKCAYTTTAILYIVAFIFDVAALGTWIVIAGDDDDDDFDTQDSSDDIGGDSWIYWLIVPPAICAIATSVGVVFAFKAVCKWEQGGAPEVSMVQAGPHVSYPAPSYPVVAVNQQAPQAYQPKTGY